MPAKRVCSQPGCPLLTVGGRCDDHRRQADLARGTRQQRGYDREHDKLRKLWAPRVARGGVICWRCRLPILPTDAWDLGHLDDRSGYGGPEHANRCNRAAGGRAAHRPGGG